MSKRWWKLDDFSKTLEVILHTIPVKEVARRYLAVVFAFIAVLVTLALIESGSASRHYFAFSARMTLFSAGMLISFLCAVLWAGQKEKLKNMKTDEGRLATINAMRLIGGMGAVAGCLAVYSAFFSLWWLFHGMLLDAGVESVKEIEQWVLHNAPYLTFLPIIGMMAGWVYWSLPMFEKAYGKANYISWMIIGGTIMFLSFFSIAMLLGVYMGPGSDIFIHLDDLPKSAWPQLK